MARNRKFDKKLKWCNLCKKPLPLDAFAANKRTASGKQDYCKTCHNGHWGKTFWTIVKATDELLAAKYGMTPGQYLDLWRKQNQKCVICEHSLVLYHRDTHVHIFGSIGRLICINCKKGLECFEENAALLRKAAEWICPSVNSHENTTPISVGM